MKTAIISTIVLLVLSFITDLLFNLIILPVKKEVEKDMIGNCNVSAGDLESFYQMNKPMILRRVPLLDFLIENGGIFFFILFSILFLIVSYLISRSLLWTLLCIPGLFLLYFIITMISLFISRVLVR